MSGMIAWICYYLQFVIGTKKALWVLIRMARLDARLRTLWAKIVQILE